MAFDFFVWKGSFATVVVPTDFVVLPESTKKMLQQINS
jgi:hypothetical protein